MRLIAAAIVGGFLGFTSPEGHSTEALLHSTAYGFSVAAPDFPRQNDAGTSVTPIIFSGPLHDGKTPSCNVQIQNLGWSLSEFRTQSLGQLKTLGLALESETPRKVSGKDALLFVSSGHDVKILTLAVPVERSMYVVTCLATADQFGTYEKAFRGVIDSFSLD